MACRPLLVIRAAVLRGGVETDRVAGHGLHGADATRTAARHRRGDGCQLAPPDGWVVGGAGPPGWSALDRPPPGGARLPPSGAAARMARTARRARHRLPRGRAPEFEGRQPAKRAQRHSYFAEGGGSSAIAGTLAPTTPSSAVASRARDQPPPGDHSR